MLLARTYGHVRWLFVCWRNDINQRETWLGKSCFTRRQLLRHSPAIRSVSFSTFSSLQLLIFVRKKGQFFIWILNEMLIVAEIAGLTDVSVVNWHTIHSFHSVFIPLLFKTKKCQAAILNEMLWQFMFFSNFSRILFVFFNAWK